MTHAPTTQWQIGQCRFDSSSHEIERLGVCTRLPKRQAQLLLRLVSVAPEVVSRQNLLDAVWQRKFVEDDVLSRAIADLRRALGDSDYIETIPKNGYRIISQVSAWVAPANPDTRALPNAPHNLNQILGDTDQVVLEPLFPAAVSLQNPTSLSTMPFLNRHLLRRRLLLGISVLTLLSLVLFANLRLPHVLFTKPQLPNTPRMITAAQLAQARPFTSAPGWEFGANMSAKSGLVAYADELADESTLASQGSAIFLSDLQGNSKRQLTPRVPWHQWPSLSDDATQLAFLRSDGKTCEVVLMRVLDLQTRIVAKCALDSSSAPAFSKDQTSLAFIMPSDAQYAASVGMIDLASGVIARLTKPNKLEGPDSDLRFVPGEAEISFSRGREAERGLFAVSRIDGRIRTLVGGNNRIQGHAWTPDGAQLIYASDAPGYRTLLELDVATLQTQVLGGRGARYPQISSVGDLIFDMAQFDANIWRVDLQTPHSEPVRTIASTRYDASPSLSPDGQQLAYVSNRNDGEQVFIANADGSNEKLLHLTQEFRWTRPSFRPDGAALLIGTYSQTAEPEVHQYLLATGQHQQMRHLGSGASSAVYSSDSQSIIYKRKIPNFPTELWLAGIDPGSPGRAIQETVGVAQFRLHQDRVVLLRLNATSDKGSFFEVSPSPNPKTIPRLLWADVPLLSQYAFSLAGDHLYVVIRVGKSSDLWRVSMAKELASVPELVRRNIRADAVGTSIVLSADARWLWFARTDRLALDLMFVPSQARTGN